MKNNKQSIKDCPFCNRESLKDQIFWENKEFFAFLVNRPKTKNHFAIATKAHLESFNPKITNLLVKQAFRLADKFSLDSLTIKINVNVWKVQPHPAHVRHIHIHVIPATQRISEVSPNIVSSKILRITRNQLKRRLSKNKTNFT